MLHLFENFQLQRDIPWQVKDYFLEMNNAATRKQLFKGTGQDIARLSQQSQAERRLKDRAAFKQAQILQQQYAQANPNQPVPPLSEFLNQVGPTQVSDV